MEIDRQKLAVDNMKLARWVTNKFRMKWPIFVARIGESEMRATAYAALVAAANAWDQAKGKFSTLAFKVIWNSLQRLVTWLTYKGRKNLLKHRRLRPDTNEIAVGQKVWEPDIIKAACELPSGWQSIVIRSRVFGDTLQEIADSRGVSKQCIQQTEERALRRLREIVLEQEYSVRERRTPIGKAPDPRGRKKAKR